MISYLFEGRSTPSIENPSVPLSEADDWLIDGAGANMSPEGAMSVSAVYSCINVIGQSLGQLPLEVLRKTADKIEVATDHPVHHLINASPNDWVTSSEWREQFVFNYLGWGNGLTRIVRSRRGEVIALHNAETKLSDLVRNGNRYVYGVNDPDGAFYSVNPDDMIHVRNGMGCKTRDGKWGVSVITQQSEMLGLAKEAQTFGNSFFRSGGKPSGIASVNGEIGKDEWALLAGTWKKIQAALRDSTSSRNVLLPADIKYTPITIPPEDAQFLETQRFTRSQVAGMFNVPSHMINDLEKATFSNISEQAVSFVRHTMMPHVVKLEQELNRKLFTRFEREAGYYVKFDLSGLLRGTPKDRAEYYKAGINDGWMNRNEVRIKENLNPQDGLDDFLIAVNQAQTIDEPSKPNGEEDEQV